MKKIMMIVKENCMKKIMMIVAALAMSLTAFATVSVDFDVATLNDANDTPIAEGIKFLIFLDKDGDGINGADLSNYFDNNSTWRSVVNSGSFLWDADDEILFNGASKGWGLTGEFAINDAYDGNLVFNLGSGIDAGDQIYALWFAEVAGAAATPGSITEVGFITDASWDLPADTGLLQVNDWGQNQSAITVVPEPASALLVAVGGAMVYALRRNTRKSIYIG